MDGGLLPVALPGGLWGAAGEAHRALGAVVGGVRRPPRRRERPRDGMAYGDDPDWRRGVAHHAFGVVGPRRHGSDASGEHQARRGWGVDGVTRARLRRWIRKRREAREAREGSARQGGYGRPACRLHLSKRVKDRSLAGTRGESPRPSASPAAAVTRLGSVRSARASCTDVRDAVGTTWSMRDGAASTQCPRGSPSRG